MAQICYRESDGYEAGSNINHQPIPIQSSDVIVLETEQCPDPLPDPESGVKGFWGQLFSAVTTMYPTSDRKGKQILATAVGGIGLIAALAGAAWLLPANPIGLAVAYGATAIAFGVVYVWRLIIASEN
jgi:hypothetical protein